MTQHHHRLWFNHSYYETQLPVCHHCDEPISLERWMTEECPALKCTPPASHVWPDAFTDRCVCGAFSASDVQVAS